MIKRILIVGLGSIGKRHLTVARKLLPEAEIGVLRHKFNRTIPDGANHVFSTMAEALKFMPQLAVIANPATFHMTSAMPLAELGVHLFIEKPLAAASEGVEKLIKTCKKTEAVLAIGYNLRFLSSLRKFKSLIEDETIGRVWSVRSEVGQYLPSWRPNSDYREGVSGQSKLGGGALLELSHEIDYMRWIFGEVEWVQAILSRQSDLLIDVEDSAHLILGFSSNPNEQTIIASLNLDFIRQDTTRMCTAIGSKGSLRWNGITGTVESWTFGNTGWKEVYKEQSTRDDSYMKEWKNLITSIAESSQPLITGEEGLKVLKIIEAARLADTSKGQVKLGSYDGL